MLKVILFLNSLKDRVTALCLHFEWCINLYLSIIWGKLVKLVNYSTVILLTVKFIVHLVKIKCWANHNRLIWTDVGSKGGGIHSKWFSYSKSLTVRMGTILLIIQVGGNNWPFSCLFWRFEGEPTESRYSQHLQPGQWNPAAPALHVGSFAR